MNVTKHTFDGTAYTNCHYNSVDIKRCVAFHRVQYKIGHLLLIILIFYPLLVVVYLLTQLQTPLSNALQQVQAAASSIAVATGVAAAPPAIAAQPPPVLTVAGSVIAQAPPITGNVDPTKIDEIRRTVYVGNLSTHVSGTVMVFCILS